jgi:hypothetical protein
MTNIPEGILPADFYVVTGGKHIGPVISFFQQLDKQDIPEEYLVRATQFQHAGLVAEVFPGKGDDGSTLVTVLEEGGDGMVEVPYHADEAAMIMFSTGILVPENRKEIVAKAREQKGHGYGWITYLALILHHYHIYLPGGKWVVEHSRTQICSQSVDYAWDKAGDHIFDDGRWPGDVKPSDLAYRLLAAGARPILP